MTNLYANIRKYLIYGTDEEVGESALRRMLSGFSCPKNLDVEHFLKHNFIEFTKKNQSVTYLVLSEDDAELLAEDMQYRGGGMVTVLEANNDKKLLDFYQVKGFKIFDARMTKANEDSGHKLI